MKKISSIIIFIFLLVSSCNYLDVVPDNVATLDNAFTDRYVLDKYIATCYSYLPWYGHPLYNVALLGCDETWFAPELGTTYTNTNGSRIARGEQNSNTPYANYWDGGGNNGIAMYIAIRDCNTLIDNVDKVPDLSLDEKERVKAEGKVLKAYYHFYLLRMYGPICLIDKSIEITSTDAKLFPYREPIDTCVNFIVRLIDEAVPALPLKIDALNTELGRLTQAAALAIKAQVLMTAASPLFNGNPFYSDVIDGRGLNLFPSEYSAEKWTRASDALKEAIDVAISAGNGLYERKDVQSPYTLSDTTKEALALRGTVTEKWNKEILWGSTKTMNGNNFQLMIQPRFNANDGNKVKSQYGATFKMAETFYTNKGVPIDEAIAPVVTTDFDYPNRFKTFVVMTSAVSILNYKYYVQTGASAAPQLSFNLNREPRFYAYLGFDRGLWYGCGKYDDKSQWALLPRFGEISGVSNPGEYAVGGYWPKKLINYQSEISSNYAPKEYSWPIIRLAELYLYYAEALNEADQPEDAKKWLNVIRWRAKIPGVDSSWTLYSKHPDAPNTKDGLRDIIQRETLIEMSFEGSRFWNLRRWKLAEKYQNAPVQGWNYKGKDQANYYVLTTTFVQTFAPRDYFWPLSVGELQRNSHLIQNPGW